MRHLNVTKHLSISIVRKFSRDWAIWWKLLPPFLDQILDRYRWLVYGSKMSPVSLLFEKFAVQGRAWATVKLIEAAIIRSSRPITGQRTFRAVHDDVRRRGALKHSCYTDTCMWQSFCHRSNNPAVHAVRCDPTFAARSSLNRAVHFLLGPQLGVVCQWPQIDTNFNLALTRSSVVSITCSLVKYKRSNNCALWLS